jgi:iron-sulfur cluster insertion protein
MSDIQQLTVTESAAKRVGELIAGEGDSSLMLRVEVSAGGCSGFQYGFDLDKEVKDDDKLIEAYGIKVVVDEMSLEILNGAEVDYVDDLVGASFRIRIPNVFLHVGFFYYTIGVNKLGRRYRRLKDAP